MLPHLVITIFGLNRVTTQQDARLWRAVNLVRQDGVLHLEKVNNIIRNLMTDKTFKYLKLKDSITIETYFHKDSVGHSKLNATDARTFKLTMK
jgi:hypothetical protein